MKKIALAIITSLLSCSIAACGSPDQMVDSNTEVTAEFMESATLSQSVFPEEEIKMEILSMATGSMFDYEYSEEYEKSIASVEYPVFSLEGEAKEHYPALANTLNTISAVKKTKQLEEYHSFLQQAKEEIKENPENFYPYEFQEKVFIRRADHKAVSLLFGGYSYAGGAHGDYYLWGENYDSATGARIRLENVVKDMDSLKSLICQELERYWSDAGFYDDLKALMEDQLDPSMEDNLSWTMDYHGISFFFNPYTLASYASGIQTVTIPFAGNETIFQEKYMEAPKSYGIQLRESDPFFYDLNGDGVWEKITVYGDRNEYDSYDGQTICINDVEYQDAVDGYSVEPMFIHLEDGRNYLYIQNLSDNDYRILSVYNLGDSQNPKEKAELVDRMGAGLETVLPETEDGPYPRMALLDPNDFCLETPTDILSTCSGIKNYSVDERGMPTTIDTSYHLKREMVFTLKRDLSVRKLDANGQETEETIMIPAGAKVTYYGTDNVSYADLLLEDGSIGRVQVTRNNWPITIDGIAIEEIFEGIVFAG